MRTDANATKRNAALTPEQPTHAAERCAYGCTTIRNPEKTESGWRCPKCRGQWSHCRGCGSQVAHLQAFCGECTCEQDSDIW